MKPIGFKEQNVVYGADQPEYIPLPSLRENDTTVTCWELSKEDLEIINKTGVVWVSQMNFGRPLQPLRVTVEKSDVVLSGEIVQS